MATETITDKAVALPGAELTKSIEKQFGAVVQTQKQMFDALVKMNQRWAIRAAADAKSATELGSKLSSARSLPDAFHIYQEWMTERAKSLAEEGQQFTADCEEFLREMTQLLSHGRPPASS